MYFTAIVFQHGKNVVTVVGSLKENPYFPLNLFKFVCIMLLFYH